MTHISHEDALAHYGVKGMKWGVRKDKSSKTSSETAKEKKARRKKAVNDALATTAVAGFVAYMWAPAIRSALNIASQVALHHLANLNNSMMADMGARAAEAALADRGLTNYRTIIQDVVG